MISMVVALKVRTLLMVLNAPFTSNKQFSAELDAVRSAFRAFVIVAAEPSTFSEPASKAKVKVPLRSGWPAVQLEAKGCEARLRCCCLW